jgi:uncharacterized protein (DUF2249 family)
MNDIIIEVQSIPAPQRHELIFAAFDSLIAGDSIIIQNNHDPKPLLSKFDEKRPTQFTLTYLVNGPIEWKVKLTKIMKEGCCGCC